MIRHYDDPPEHLKEELKDYVVIPKSVYENMAFIMWNIDDVRIVATEYYHEPLELTDDQCREVLNTLEVKHDAEYGVSWSTIQNTIDSLFT